jgi:hypothetical protein
MIKPGRKEKRHRAQSILAARDPRDHLHVNGVDSEPESGPECKGARGQIAEQKVHGGTYRDVKKDAGDVPGSRAKTKQVKLDRVS